MIAKLHTTAPDDLLAFGADLLAHGFEAGAVLEVAGMPDATDDGRYLLTAGGLLVPVVEQ